MVDENDLCQINEVLASIWNVIQDNGLDIDIEQDYRKGKAEGYNKAIDDFVNSCKENTMCKTFGLREIDIEKIAEQLKEGGQV